MLKSFVVIIIIFSLFTSSCSAEWWLGDGSGDGEFSLCSGYYITKVNSKEIVITYKENPDDPGGSFVITNYFVTAYQSHKPYIYLQGIKTQSMSASDKELESRNLIYYLIDTTDGNVIGPFDTEEQFFDECESYQLTTSEEWIQTKDAF